MASTKRAKAKRQKSLKQLPLFLKFLPSLVLTLIGALLIVWTSIQSVGWVVKPKEYAQTTQTDNSKSPVKLYIPTMSKVLYVTEGFVTGDRWSTTPIGVSYYTASALPGQGNTVIYGHNTIDAMGGLWRVHEGDDIYVVLANGDFIKYKVAETKEIDPAQIEILNQTVDSRITLYTCSGTLDTARFVVIARSTV